ncbi:helix-turn-helix domain-containing protein [Metapseudomonas resinovorans]|uniref:HTH cro/C1-type domain-containing protein n=1 Tax=Metapseudomonas resinovorans NBRC 106553 TaxID=1245471 RepID=S6ARE8_METRE|nr:helix-turn-helix domain-containing protein [Pseudomonas resinovorans]BAN48473.1 hypothetical protein PCA10_27410 [Pseudomonas resinovorans NBRC 106553]
MDASILARRLGAQITEMRHNRGLTIIKLASLAGVTRQKLSEIEKGRLTVSMAMYAQVISALDAQITLVPAFKPTLEELEDLFKESKE